MNQAANSACALVTAIAAARYVFMMKSIGVHPRGLSGEQCVSPVDSQPFETDLFVSVPFMKKQTANSNSQHVVVRSGCTVTE